MSTDSLYVLINQSCLVHVGSCDKFLSFASPTTGCTDHHPCQGMLLCIKEPWAGRTITSSPLSLSDGGGNPELIPHPSNPRGQLLVLGEEADSPQEQEAMELVLKLFYSGQLSDALLPSSDAAKSTLLLNALIVAERYQAERCRETCALGLSSIPPSSLTLTMARAAYDLPLEVLNSDSLSGLRSNVKSTFFHEMFIQDALAVNSCPQLTSLFLNLTEDKILEWVRREDIQLDSENDIVHLLNQWFQHTQFGKQSSVSVTGSTMTSMNQALGIKDSHHRLVEIVSCIRVIQLGPAYMTHVLPDLWWFKRSGLESHLRMAYYLSLNEGAMSHQTILQGCLSFPPHWRLPKRKPEGDIGGLSSASITWTVGEEDLRKLMGKECRVDNSHSLYLNGHNYKISLVTSKNPSRDTVVSARVSLTPIFSTSYQVVQNLIVVLLDQGHQGGQGGRVVRATGQGLGSGRSVLFSAASGGLDHVLITDRTIEAALAPYLLGGDRQLSIKLEVQDVDKSITASTSFPVGHSFSSQAPLPMSSIPPPSPL